MGAWGVGMRANDEALDAVADFTRLRTAKAANIRLAKIIAKSDSGDEPWLYRGSLGVAEFMLDKGFPLSQENKTGILKAIRHELSESSIERWREPEERRQALRRFKQRVEMGKFDEKEKEVDNLGLLAKINLHAHGIHGRDRDTRQGK